MNIDLKHELLKNFLSDQKLGQKPINTAVGQSMVPGTAQKSLGNELLNESEKDDFKNKKKKSNKQVMAEEKNEKQNAESKKIERDPLVLLKLL